jgi:hypothetical protein
MKKIIKEILQESRLYNETDDKYKDLVGKRVCVPYVNNSKNIEQKYDKGERVCGILQYAGVNKTHGKFQVTVDRTPIWPINPKDIELQN